MMISLSYFWFGVTFWLAACLGGIAGFMLCALLTMSKRADEAMATFRTDYQPDSGESKDS